MAKVTTKEMIALIDEDIKFALEIGDKEFVRYLRAAKAKLLDAEYPTPEVSLHCLYYLISHRDCQAKKQEK